MPVRPVIASSAHRHQVADEDVLHAYVHAFRVFDLDEGFVMHIGADRSGTMLEVGSVRGDGDLVVIVHAMNARPKFLR